MSEPRQAVAILAGNSRLDRTPDGDILVEPQIEAFKVGLGQAKHIRDRTGLLPPLAVALDHKGVFRKGFLGTGLTNSQKRNPRLSQLHSQVVLVFAAAAAEVGIDLTDVRVIHEDSARTYLDYLLKENRFDPELAAELFVPRDAEECGPLTGCTVGDGHGFKPTCQAITTEYYRRAVEEHGHAAPAVGLLEVYIEDNKWSSPDKNYLPAVDLAHRRGVRVAIRLHTVGKGGKVLSGAICMPD